MRSLSLFAAMAALTLSACAATSTSPPGSYPAVGTVGAVADAVNLPPPVSIADRTKLDETVGIGFETAVTAAADLATLAVRTGVVPTNRLGELRERVAWARAAVAGVRAAYDTGNAASYKVAVAGAQCAIARVQSLATGKADAPCDVAKEGVVR